MDKIKLSIIILNYKSAGLVKQCLKGLGNLSLDFSYEIIVVDNNSHDNLEEMIIKNYPNVKFIRAKKNRGFASGNNFGLRKAVGDYLLILNPDIAVLEGSLQKMLAFLKHNEKIGMVVPQLLNPDRTIQNSVMRFPRFIIPVYRRTFLGKFTKPKKMLKWYLMKDWDHNSNRVIEWALGACMMVKREALEDVGYLDERYFLYVEDTDWCRRFWEKDWQINYVASARMIHYHMRESAENFFTKLNIIHILSWLKYFWKFKNRKKIKLTNIS